MKNGRPQAKDISDKNMLESVVRHAFTISMWAMWGDIAKDYPAMPKKVVLAKLRGLYERDLLGGCPCGCRGDFYLTRDGAGYLCELGGVVPAGYPVDQD